MPCAISRHARNAVLPALIAAAFLLSASDTRAGDKDAVPADWQLTGTLGVTDTNGSYGTPLNTNVLLSLGTLSLSDGNFKFTASIPYMRISGRGLVVFDASGNPIVINRRTNVAPDVRTGWGDVNLSASYMIPPAILDDFQITLTGIAKVPTGPTHRRLSTGEADFGVNLDVARQFGVWGPFVTVGYLNRGQPAGFTLYSTTSVSAGTSLEISKNWVAVASYDYDSSDTPLVPAGHELLGSLSWIRDDRVTLTGYGTAGLSAGSPDFGVGFLISYRLN